MRTRSAATTQHQVVQALQRPHHARPPWTSHLSTGRACGQPLRGSWPAHRSPADAFGLTRFACPTPIDQRTQTLRQRPALSDPTQTPQTTDTSTVLPGGVWGGHRWRNLKWPSGGGLQGDAGAVPGMRPSEVTTLRASQRPGPLRVSTASSTWSHWLKHISRPDAATTSSRLVLPLFRLRHKPVTGAMRSMALICWRASAGATRRCNICST